MKKRLNTYINLLSLLFIILLFLNSCKPDETMAVIETNEVTFITEATATCGGMITSDGGAIVEGRGVCWSISPNPTIENIKTSDAAGTGAFTSTITGLTSGTTYYVRAYATNKAGTGYGLQITFKTKSFALTTTPISFLLATSAICGGTIASDGDSLTVTARGVCWNTFPNPTIFNNKTTNGVGGGLFVSIITELTPSTTYFVRAYSTNSVGTIYGNEVSFTTQSGVIGLTTVAVSSITDYSAICGGTISSDGGATITERGICWNTTPNPSTSNNKTSNGSGTGSFTSNIIGLIPSTTYFVRSYATNIVGTCYGNEVSFTAGYVNYGSGTSADPYTAEWVISQQSGSRNGWVKGYIVGAVKSGINASNPINGNEDISWAAPFMYNTIVITTDSLEKDWKKCVVVSLPANSPLRDSVNLTAYPTHLGKVLAVTGTFANYLGAAGVTVATGAKTEYWLGHPPVAPVITGGDGTKENPYSVAQAMVKQGEAGKWVTGYIVGYINSGTTPYAYTYASGSIYSNIIIADSPSSKTDGDCLPVQLVSGTAVRTALNVGDNPVNIGKKVSISGNLEAYFSVPGLKAPTDYVLEGGTTPPVGTDILSETFLGSLGNFTTYSVSGAELWTGSNYGAVMSGFANSVCNTNEDWLISPAMNLTGITSATLTFSHTINKGDVANIQTNHTLWISTNYSSGAPSTATWTQVTIPTYPTGIDWTFVGSGNIALPSAVLGNSNARFAFKYLCSGTESASWEIKNLKVLLQC